MYREANGTVSWFLSDRLGSIRAEYDATGRRTARYEYTPYGAPVGSTPQDYGFTGEPHDATTGLVYLRARWYDPGRGMFTSRDPFGGALASPPTLHPYGYAYGNPMRWTDPSGRIPPLVVVGAVIALGVAALVPATAYAPDAETDPASLPPSDTFEDAKAFFSTAPVFGDINDACILGFGYDPIYGEDRDPDATRLLALLPLYTSGMGRFADEAADLARWEDEGGSILDELISWQLPSNKVTQAANRGWTNVDIDTTIHNPAFVKPGAINKATKNPATVFYRADGHYVVRDDVTGDIVQVSRTQDPDWVDPFGETIRPRP